MADRRTKADVEVMLLRTLIDHSHIAQNEWSKWRLDQINGLIAKMDFGATKFTRNTNLVSAVAHLVTVGNATVMEEHPELNTFWQKNNNATDDYRSLMNMGNADLRTIYFNIVKSHGGKKGGFEAAAPFLHDPRRRNPVGHPPSAAVRSL